MPVYLISSPQHPVFSHLIFLILVFCAFFLHILHFTFLSKPFVFWGMFLLYFCLILFFFCSSITFAFFFYFLFSLFSYGILCVVYPYYLCHFLLFLSFLSLFPPHFSSSYFLSPVFPSVILFTFTVFQPRSKSFSFPSPSNVYVAILIFYIYLFSSCLFLHPSFSPLSSPIPFLLSLSASGCLVIVSACCCQVISRWLCSHDKCFSACLCWVIKMCRRLGSDFSVGHSIMFCFKHSP